MNKKGFYFIMLAIFISLIVYFFIRLETRDDYDTFELQRNKVFIANNIINSFEKEHMPIIFKAATYALMENITHADNLSQLNITFADNLLNFTLRNKTYDANKTFLNITDFYKQYYDLDVNLTIVQVNLFQSNITGPWQVGVNISYNLTLKAEDYGWIISNRSKTFLYSIIGLEDSYYKETTEKTIINLEPLDNDVSALGSLYNSHRYTNNSAAPSYLQRFVSLNLSSECCGITYLVNHDTEPLKKQPSWDFCYYQPGDYMYSKCGLTTYRVFGVGAENFRLSSQDTNRFDVLSIDNRCIYDPATKLWSCT